MDQFPAKTSTGDLIRPTERSFSIGEFPTRSYRSLSGAVVKRSFGNRATNYTLDVTFGAVGEQVLIAIYEHYQQQQGVTMPFSLPETIFDGYSSYIEQIMREPEAGTNSWYYAEAPKITSKPNGLSDISVRFMSEIPAQLTITIG